jgi:hypothetical protein
LDGDLGNIGCGEDENIQTLRPFELDVLLEHGDTEQLAVGKEDRATTTSSDDSSTRLLRWAWLKTPSSSISQTTAARP